MRKCKVKEKESWSFDGTDAKLDIKYIEGCSFIKWVDSEYEERVEAPIGVGHNEFFIKKVAAPHGLIEFPDGKVDLVPYFNFEFTDETDIIEFDYGGETLVVKRSDWVEFNEWRNKL